MITSPLVVFPKELVIIVLNLGMYNVIDGDASCAHGRVQLVGKCNLPVVPTVVGPALAGVNSSNINLTKIVFGLLALHGFFIPEIRLGYKPALVMVLNTIDQGLEPFDLHCTENHSSSDRRSSGHALCHFGYIGVSV